MTDALVNVRAIHYMLIDAVWVSTSEEAARVRSTMRRVSWPAAIALLSDDAWCKAVSDDDVIE